MYSHLSASPGFACLPQRRTLAGAVSKWLERKQVDRLQILVVVLVAMLSLLFSALLAYSVLHTTRAKLDEQAAETRSLALSMKQFVTAAAQLIDHTLKQSRDEWVATASLGDHRAFYTNFPNFKNLILQVAVIDAQGMLRATSIDPDAKQVFLGDREHFRVHLGATPQSETLFVGKPLIGRVSKRPSVQFSRPIFDAQGQFSGVVVASMEPSFLDNFLNTSTEARDVSFGLIGTDGIIRGWSGTMRFELEHARPSKPAIGLESGVARSNAGAPEGAVTGHFRTPELPTQPPATWFVGYVDPYPFSVVVGRNQSALLHHNSEAVLLAAGLGLLFLTTLNAAGFYGVRALRLRQRLLQRLRESQLKADSANRVKSRFLADISHELRTPLNGILGFSELVSQAGSPEKSAQYGQVIHTSAKHLHHLVNTMLDLAKIEAGRMAVVRADCDLRELFDSVAGIHRLAAEKKGVALHVQHSAITKYSSRIVSTDRVKLMQIINNILHNAVKFTHQGRIEVRVSRFMDWWSFTVTDTGIGMDAAQVNKLFERFSFSDLTHQGMHEGQGSGLGMPLSKELIELLGGSIAVQSEPGVGTEVEARFAVVEAAKP